MTDAPAPLTPAECDLRGLGYMPLDVVRLVDSDLVALSSGDEFKAAVVLWSKAWLQVPAASLPDDDRVLAHLSSTGSRWAKLKGMALRGWVKCSDGRLYHPVIAEKALAAWEGRIAQRARTEAARAARAQNRKGTTDAASGQSHRNVVGSDREAPQSVTEAVTTPVTDNVTGSKYKGEGESKKKEKEEDIPLPTVAPSPQPARTAPPDGPGDDFDAFWQAYPRKVGKHAARKAYGQARKSARADELLQALARQRWPDDVRYVPHPATWLHGGRWEDDPEASAPPPVRQPPPRLATGLDLYARRMFAKYGDPGDAALQPFGASPLDLDHEPLTTETVQ